MDIEGFRKQVEYKVIEVIESEGDLTKYDYVNVVSDHAIRRIAKRIKEEEYILTFFKNAPKNEVNVVKSRELIHIGEDLSVIHFTLDFDEGNWPHIDEIFEEIKEKHYLYCGESTWNWTRIVETESICKDGIWYPPGTFKKNRETKEIELAKRSADHAVNRILIVLYERLISKYPKNRDLYSAFCSVLENNCLFDRRIEILEEMYKRFNDYYLGVSLAWAYGDNGDKENASRVRKLLAKRDKEDKDEQSENTKSNFK